MARLHFELTEHYEEAEWPMIRHPLVYAVPFFDTVEEIVRLNKMLDRKKKLVSEALGDNNWEQYIFLHERAYRAQAFSEIQESMSDACYWRILASVWIDTENVYQERMLWWQLLTSTRRERSKFSDVPPEVVRKLPKIITIYRGTKRRERKGSYLGYSWTIDKSRAIWFATRITNSGMPVVATAHVYSVGIVGYLKGRGEEEVVVTPSHVFDITWEKV